MATDKLLFVFISIAVTAISLYAADARILPFKWKLQFNNHVNSPPLNHLLRHSQAVTKPWRFIHHVPHQTRKNARAYRSFPSIKFEVDGTGVFIAPPPPSSHTDSPLKAVVVIFILVLISSAAAAVIRIFCVHRDDPAERARHIADVAQHAELTICKCNNSFTLFPGPPL